MILGIGFALNTLLIWQIIWGWPWKDFLQFEYGLL
jgi:hypothetical protein